MRLEFVCAFVFLCESCCLMRVCGLCVVYCVMLCGALFWVWRRWLRLFCVNCVCAFCL